MSRTATIQRKTAETDIELELNLDGSGTSNIATGVGFFDHMLTLLAKHAAIDLTVRAKGDLHVDQHHTVEDVGICLGQALRQALGDKAGIRRYGHFTLPMEETLVTSAIDLSGRYYLVFQAAFPAAKIGDFDSELVEDFWQAVAANALCNLHVLLHYGRNSHHITEAIFKATARACGWPSSPTRACAACRAPRARSAAERTCASLVRRASTPTRRTSEGVAVDRARGIHGSSHRTTTRAGVRLPRSRVGLVWLPSVWTDPILTRVGRAGNLKESTFLKERRHDGR